MANTTTTTPQAKEGSEKWLREELAKVVERNPDAVVYVAVKHYSRKTAYHPLVAVAPSMWAKTNRNIYVYSESFDRTIGQHCNAVGLQFEGELSVRMRAQYGENILDNPDPMTAEMWLDCVVRPLHSHLGFHAQVKVIVENNRFQNRFYYFQDTQKWWTRTQLEKAAYKGLPEHFDALFEVHEESPRILTSKIPFCAVESSLFTDPMIVLMKQAETCTCT